MSRIFPIKTVCLTAAAFAVFFLTSVAIAQPEDIFTPEELTLQDGEVQIVPPPVELLVTERQIKLLADALSSKDPFLRQQAAEDLGETGKVEVAKYLAKACESLDWQTRQAAVRALSAVPANEHQSIAVMLLGDPQPEVRAEAARALSAMEMKKAADKVLTLLKDEEPAVRIAAIDALGKLGGSKTAKVLVELLDKSPLTSTGGYLSEIAALERAIGRLKVAAAIPILSDKLDHDSPMIRTVAVEAIGEIGDESGEEISQKAMNDPHPSVRAAAIKALFEINPRENIPLFVNHLDDVDATVRMRSSEALGDLGYKPALEKLALLTGDELEPTAMAAENAIFEIGGEEAISIAGEMLTSKSARTRIAASRLLGRFKSNMNLEEHIALLKYEDVHVVKVAAYSLGLVGDERASPALRKLIEWPLLPKEERPDYDSAYLYRASMCAAFSLGRLKDKEAIPTLVKHATRPTGIATAAIWALGKIGATKYKDINVTGKLSAVLMNNGMFFIPLHPEATKALGRLKDPAALPALESKLTGGGNQSSMLLAWAIDQCGGVPPEIEVKTSYRRPDAVIQDRTPKKE
jgi:HEAT repeat protein